MPLQISEPRSHIIAEREDGTRDVVHWQLGSHVVPAVHRVRATLVRYPVQHYVHAYYGAELMAARSENIARLGWSSTSFDLPGAPEIVGHFNLLSQAVSVARKELQGGRSSVNLCFPAAVQVRQVASGRDWFKVYLNLFGFEFYHLLFVAGDERPSSQFTVEPADVGTCPKLLSWLRRFEAAKKTLYRDSGFDWNPRRGPIELGPTRGEL